MHIYDYDVVVIGAGLAGERAAIEANRQGANVAIISLVQPRQSHSNAAQGGIQCSLDNMGEHSAGDDWKLHFDDTVRGSDWGADQDVIERATRAAPRIVRELEYWGTPFNRTSEGKIEQRNFGGTTVWRAAFAADFTGHALLYACDQEVLRAGIDVYWRMQVLSLILNGNRVIGCIVMDLRSGELLAFLARATILATGGAGRIYSETTNAVICRGDGLCIAYNTGLVPLGNMEAVQFHPTGLYPIWILLTEGCRGDGGVLRNKDGHEFMWDYAEKKGNLASRDVVSRSMMSEIRKGKGVEGPFGPHLWLDLTHLGAEKIMSRLRDVHDIARDFAGVDVIREMAPVRPVQHYTMGGVRTDIDARAKGVEGLYAAGECACWDMHGFNRLGGNSLLDTLVAGYYSGLNAAEEAKGISSQSGDLPALHSELKLQKERIDKLIVHDADENSQTLIGEMAEVMTHNVGIFRTGDVLKEGISKLLDLRARSERVGLKHKKSGANLELELALRVTGMIDIALAVAQGALMRTESRGAHYREDFPNRDDEKWLNRTLAYKQKDDYLPRLEYEDVVITHLQPGDRGYGEKAPPTTSVSE
ncbi:MAG TPA: FAD-binding protein [Firmicutes bacterium]|nr:FAD-binding protein [Bacillota bacterium]